MRICPFGSYAAVTAELRARWPHQLVLSKYASGYGSFEAGQRRFQTQRTAAILLKAKDSYDLVQFSGIEMGRLPARSDPCPTKKAARKSVYDALNAEAELQRVVAWVDAARRLDACAGGAFTRRLQSRRLSDDMNGRMCTRCRWRVIAVSERRPRLSSALRWARRFTVHAERHPHGVRLSTSASLIQNARSVINGFQRQDGLPAKCGRGRSGFARRGHTTANSRSAFRQTRLSGRRAQSSCATCGPMAQDEQPYHGNGLGGFGRALSCIRGGDLCRSACAWGAERG